MKIYQTYSDPSQKSFLGTGVIPYDYTYNTGTEYEIFKDLSSLMMTQDEPWGVISWKFELKTHVSIGEFSVAARKAFDNGAECVFINPMYGAEAVFSNVWEQGVECGHHGMEKIIAYLLSKGYLRETDLLMSRSVFAFCNYFIATNRFWREYFRFVDSVLLDLSGQEAIGSEVGLVYGGESHYWKNPNLTMKPFVVERLFSTFIPQCGFQTCAVEVDLAVYKAKFGNLLGNTLYELSKLKGIYSKLGLKESYQAWNIAARLIRSGHIKNALAYLDDPDVTLAKTGLAVCNIKP